jgi:hypothetical protein
MSTLLTIGEFASDSYMGSTGTKPANAVQVAIDMAESDVSIALGFPIDDDGSPAFISAEFTEEHKWPIPNRPLLLNSPRIISLDTIYARHDLGTCDCEWTDLTACGFIHNAKVGIVKFRTCERAASCWVYCGCPQRVQVTYTAGFTAAEVADTTPTGRRLRLAIALQARALLELQDFYTDGNVAISSWSSLGYSEKREFTRSARGKKMGLSILSQAAANVLEPLVVKRGGAVMLRSQ